MNFANGFLPGERFLLMKASAKPGYSFRADGGREDVELARSLVKCGVSLPAEYQVRWNDEASAWVGVLRGELTQDALAHSIGKKRGRRSKTNEAV